MQQMVFLSTIHNKDHPLHRLDIQQSRETPSPPTNHLVFVLPSMWDKCCSLLLVLPLICGGQAQILFNNKANQASADASPTALSIMLQKLKNVAIKAMK